MPRDQGLGTAAALLESSALAESPCRHTLCPTLTPCFFSLGLLVCRLVYCAALCVCCPMCLFPENSGNSDLLGSAPVGDLLGSQNPGLEVKSWGGTRLYAGPQLRGGRGGGGVAFYLKCGLPTIHLQHLCPSADLHLLLCRGAMFLGPGSE